jgi:hypothetical protein
MSVTEKARGNHTIIVTFNGRNLVTVKTPGNHTVTDTFNRSNLVNVKENVASSS